MPRRHPPKVLAHRGARAAAPENTLEAFRLALEQGADGVELDLHRTADDDLVVHHDAEAPGLGVLADLPFAVIRDARPDIPRLEEVLDACTGSLVNVEIKNLPGDADYDDTERVADLLVATLVRRRAADHVLVSSFNLPTVDRVRQLTSAVPTGFLVMFGIDPLDALGLAADHGHAALHPFRGMLATPSGVDLVDRAEALDLALNVWTVNDVDEIERLTELGVDAVITDVPDVVRRVVDGLPGRSG